MDSEDDMTNREIIGLVLVLSPLIALILFALFRLLVLQPLFGFVMVVCIVFLVYGTYLLISPGKHK